MRISEQQIANLKKLLVELCDRDFKDEEVQDVGIAIMRFAVAKHRNRNLETIKEGSDESATAKKCD